MSFEAPGYGLESVNNRWGRWLFSPLFLPACLVVGVGVRLAVALLIPVEPFSDYAWYIARANDILGGNGYQENGTPTAYWPVGWPALLALAILIFQSTTVAIVTWNLASAALTLLAIYWFGRNVLGSEGAGRVAMLLYAIYPNHIAYAGVPATEPVYTALLLTGFLLLIVGRKRLAVVVFAGLLFGVATLIKPQTLLFPIGGVIALWWVYREFRAPRMLVTMGVVYFCLLLVVLPWSYRNLNVFGEFVLVSTNGGTALYLGANDKMTGGHFDMTDEETAALVGIPWEQRVQGQVELNGRLKELATQWIRENPLEYLSWMPYKVLRLWYKDTDGFWAFDHSYPEAKRVVRSLQLVNQVYYGLVLLLSLPVAFLALRALIRRDEAETPLALLFCVPVFVSLLAAVFTGQIRYHYSAMPFLFLAASWAIVHPQALRGLLPFRGLGGRTSQDDIRKRSSL